MIKFQHRKYSETLLKHRLRLFYKLSDQNNKDKGLNWYTNAKAWLQGIADANNLPVNIVAGCFAALSPKKNIKENKRLLLQFLSTDDAGTYKFLVQKCRDIMTATTNKEISTILNGQKIMAYFDNCLKPETSTKITIDRHAIACLIQTPNKTRPLTDKEQQMTVNQYKAFEQIYIDVANEYNILPCKFQAILWETYREIRELQESAEFEQAPF